LEIGVVSTLPGITRDGAVCLTLRAEGTEYIEQGLLKAEFGLRTGAKATEELCLEVQEGCESYKTKD
jgi:hypothetical protein